MRSPNRTPFNLLDLARVRGGQILTVHGWRCATHSGGDCGCNPSFKLQRERKVRGR